MKYSILALLLNAMTTTAFDLPPATPPSLLERLQQALKSEDRPFTLVIQISIKPGNDSLFEAAAAKAAKATTAEKGCLTYEFQRDLDKPNHYILIERWTGIAAIRKHLDQEHTKQIQAIFRELSTAPLKVEIFAPIEGK